jgi:hypothetical protein
LTTVKRDSSVSEDSKPFPVSEDSKLKSSGVLPCRAAVELSSRLSTSAWSMKPLPLSGAASSVSSDLWKIRIY